MNRQAKRVIGLLGGIGSGKSLVARILRDLGAAVIDADAIAGDCLADPGIRGSLEKEFGPRIAGSDGKVDRKALADLVFADESMRRKLHRIMHPEILRRMRADLDRMLAACEGADEWDADRARDWWNIHLPPGEIKPEDEDESADDESLIVAQRALDT